MKKQFLLFGLLCAIVLGCSETQTADNFASPPDKGEETESSSGDDSSEAVSTSSDESSGADLTSAPQAMFNAVEKDFNDAFQLFLDKSSEAEGEKAKQAVFEELCPRPEQYTDRFFAVYETHPKSEMGQRALEWIAMRDGNSELGKKAMGLLVSRHKDRDRLPILVSNLQYADSTRENEAMLRGLIADETTPTLKGVAMMTLASYLVKLDGEKRLAESNKASIAPETVDYIEKSTVSLDEVKSLYENVKKEYADCKIADEARKTLGEMADDAIFILENLSIGCVAPEIEGEDLEGATFKLSDYRGKVVVLDFWGDW